MEPKIILVSNFFQHLARVRRVYLLEAGDLILDFNTEIFARLESLEMSRNDDSTLWSERRSEFQLDPLTLTLFLHDCLGRRSDYGEAIYRFKVDLDCELVKIVTFSVLQLQS